MFLDLSHLLDGPPVFNHENVDELDKANIDADGSIAGQNLPNMDLLVKMLLVI